jgi:hypothetical protein
MNNKLIDRKLIDRKLHNRKVIDSELRDRKLIDRKLRDRNLIDRKLRDRNLIDKKWGDRKRIDKKTIGFKCELRKLVGLYRGLCAQTGPNITYRHAQTSKTVPFSAKSRESRSNFIFFFFF